MSRTKRSTPKTSGYARYFRSPQTKNIQTAEHYAAQELAEEGFKPPPRQAARSHKGSRKIPTAWDDIRVAAWMETDHRK